MSLNGGKITGKVGGLEIGWLSPPRGVSGTARAVLADGRELEVSWKRDGDGVWIELAGGTYGFDFDGEAGEDGRVSYVVSQRGRDAQWEGLAYLRAGEDAAAAGRSGAKKSARVRAQMPGKILRVLVKPGAPVEAGQALLVMEAMKMENEIKAQGSGKVKEVKVTEGQAVETGADLLLIDPD